MADIPTNPTAIGQVPVTDDDTPATYARIIGLVGGRKFIAFIAVLASVHSLAWKFPASFAAIYSTVAIAAIAAYIAGNVTQKAVTKTTKNEEKVTVS